MRIRIAVLAVCLMSAAACSGPRPASPAATPPETASSGTGAVRHRRSRLADVPPDPGPRRGGARDAGRRPAPPSCTRSSWTARCTRRRWWSRGLTIVATENDTVYAFDGAYRQVWKRGLGSPSPAEERQCGDIDPLGITGTPVYDAATGHVLVVGRARRRGAARAVRAGRRDGRGRPGARSVDLPGVSARDMQQRGALAIAHGRVWVPYGAQAGDCGDYKGRVVGVRLDGTGEPVYYSPPTERGGGMWNPAGPTVDAAGNLLVVSANGAAFPGDAVRPHELGARAGRRRQAAWTRSHRRDWAENNQGDVGLGSQGVALVGSQWAVLGGKSGPVYVLRQGHLGGIAGQVVGPGHLQVVRRSGGQRQRRLPARAPTGSERCGSTRRPPARAVARGRARSPRRRSSAAAGCGPWTAAAASCTPSTRRPARAWLRWRSAPPTGSRPPRCTARRHRADPHAASPSSAPASARFPRRSWSCGCPYARSIGFCSNHNSRDRREGGSQAARVRNVAR